MKRLTPTLTFDGTCRDAMTLYKNILGGELEIIPFEGSPVDVPDNYKDKVLHSTLASDVMLIIASDCMPGQNVVHGSSMSITIECSSREEVDRMFDGFSKEGKVLMPLEDMFWEGRYGLIADKFGILWGFHFDLANS